MVMSSNRRRSSHAQLKAMQQHWPDFKGKKKPDGTLVWIGRLKPKAQIYKIGILWKPTVDRPYVMLIDPPLCPRMNGQFEDIPHLMFLKEKPEYSGLCLFDSEGKEWSNVDLIAETTVPWTAEWLLYYELWHLTGEWHGPGVGYESVAQMSVNEARVVRETITDVH